MSAGRKTQTFLSSERPLGSLTNGKGSFVARKLSKNSLGGAIFGCNKETMKECLTKQLFGLPSTHFSFVRNIMPGLPLFLFNYSDRMMHGIYEAASHGQINIDPYAWTDMGAVRTPFPAQVRVYVKKPCLPLSEHQFKKAIQDNYYIHKHFCFELDHTQVDALISLFKPLPIHANVKQAPVPVRKAKFFPPLPATIGKARKNPEGYEYPVGEVEEARPSSEISDVNAFESFRLDDVYVELGDSSKSTSSAPEDREIKEKVWDWGNWEVTVQGNNSTFNPHPDDKCKRMLEQHSDDDRSGTDVLKLLDKLKGICVQRSSSASSLEHSETGTCIAEDVPKGNGLIEDSILDNVEVKTNLHYMQENAMLVEIIEQLAQRTISLENKQADADQEMRHLRNVVKESGRTIEELTSRLQELGPSQDCPDIDYLDSEKVIYLIGGFNGTSWLSSLDSFSPSKDMLKPLMPMSSPRSYASVAALNDNIFIFGGGDGNTWYDSVECYKRSGKSWTSCPKLNHPKGSLAGATLNEKIYAIGGGDGCECLSEVEMFDPILGSWIINPPMLHRRFATAAVELDGAIYTVGGYDGKGYLISAERFDSREGYWTRLPSMNLPRGCHSVAVLNKKIYALGGYDGDNMVSNIEIFDPRLGSWMIGEPMSTVRGYAAAVVLDDSLYIIGGLRSAEDLCETVECYKEGVGWSLCVSKSVHKRCFLSAVVL